MRIMQVLIEMLAFVAGMALLTFLWWYDRSRLVASLREANDELETANRHISNARSLLLKNGLKDPGPSGDWAYGMNWEDPTGASNK
jgi:hypothetical protein